MMLSPESSLSLRAVPADLYQRPKKDTDFDPNDSLFKEDAEFDWLYPENYQVLSLNHWSPLSIARRAGNFLSLPGSRVLDIGSGIGKFCLTAAHYHPHTCFSGVEQREDLIHFARQAQEYTGINNVSFIHANVTSLDFDEFDHFYFYNSFHENLDEFNRIDDTVKTSSELHQFYTEFLFKAFSTRPEGTRLATFHCQGIRLPEGYELMDSSSDGLLRLYIKRAW